MNQCLNCKQYYLPSSRVNEPYPTSSECGEAFIVANEMVGDSEQLGLLLQDILFSLAINSNCPRYKNKFGGEKDV